MRRLMVLALGVVALFAGGCTRKAAHADNASSVRVAGMPANDCWRHECISTIGRVLDGLGYRQVDQSVVTSRVDVPVPFATSKTDGPFVAVIELYYHSVRFDIVRPDDLVWSSLHHPMFLPLERDRLLLASGASAPDIGNVVTSVLDLDRRTLSGRPLASIATSADLETTLMKEQRYFRTRRELATTRLRVVIHHDAVYEPDVSGAAVHERIADPDGTLIDLELASLRESERPSDELQRIRDALVELPKK